MGGDGGVGGGGLSLQNCHVSLWLLINSKDVDCFEQFASGGRRGRGGRQQAEEKKKKKILKLKNLRGVRLD